MAEIIKYPFGAADAQTIDFTEAVAIQNSKTFLAGGSITGNKTLDLDVAEGVVAGDEVIVTATASGANRTITHGTGLAAGSVVITSGNTDRITYVYDGTQFIKKSVVTA